jgi:hypothetical protein
MPEGRQPIRGQRPKDPKPGPSQAKAETRPVGPGQWRPAAEPTGPAAEPARPAAEPARPAAELNKSGPVGRACMELPNGALESLEGNLF